MKKMLVISKENDSYRIITSCLKKEFSVNQAMDRESAVKMLKKKRYDILFADLEIITGSGEKTPFESTMREFWEIYPSIEIVVMSPPEKIRDAVSAVKAGASSYLTYPIEQEEVRHVTETIYDAVKLQSELDYLRDKFWQADFLETVQTKNKKMQSVFNNIRSVAPTRSTVLICGETGVGKSVLAKLIHRHSNRNNDRFISVHCGAIPDTLLESELFGHEKGAFTGAVRRKLGKFEIASGGTIFLDEIGTISASAQIKLLNVIQEGVFSRLGGEDSLHTDVRIIAATNADLKKMSDLGEFRKDLYYRLNVFPIETPPLRERTEDIPFFIDVFLRKLKLTHKKEIHGVHPEVSAAFEKYDWPGNIRELENLIERAYILESSSILNPESFPGELFQSKIPPAYAPVDYGGSLAEARKTATENFERRYIEKVLTQHKGKIKASARTAEISTRQLSKLMKKYGIRKEKFKSVPESTTEGGQ